MSACASERQLHLAEVLAGLDQHQRAFIDHHSGRALARHMHRLGLCRDGGLHLVDQLARRYRDTDGDIRSLLAALFSSAAFRDPAMHRAKFKNPYRYVLSSLRATGQNSLDVRLMLGALLQQGMPLHGCATPDGYKNTEVAWLNPDATTRRVAFATALGSGRLPMADAAPVDDARLMATLGPMLSDRTRTVVNQAEPLLRSALILGSPDFMRY